MKKSSKQSQRSAQPKGQSKQGGQIRIIAGTHRGRKLPVIEQQGLRPTTDRVKETLFNWLMHDIAESRCLDCFAGSGSLGFEALSRHADFVHFVELYGPAAKQLQLNIESLGANNAAISQTNALTLLDSSPDNTFDIVFIDPPFGKNLVQPVIDKLDSNNWLSDDAQIYIETESSGVALDIPVGWRLQREKTAGQVSYCLYEKSGD